MVITYRDLVKFLWIRSRAYYFESFTDYCKRRRIVLNEYVSTKVA